MKIWQLSSDKYGIKKRLSKKLFRALVEIDGVKYNKKTWRIEFNKSKIELIKEVISPLEIMKGQNLLDRLYRISKFKPRKELMPYAVMLHEAKEYIYMILTDKAFELLDDYEGVLVAYDPKVKAYAEELIYLNQREKLKLYEEELDNFSIEDIIEVLDSKHGSILDSDLDSAPYLFLHQYQDLELSLEKKNKLFKKELSAKNVTAFNLERLVEMREIKKEVWFPVFENLVEKEIIKRRNRLNRIIEKKGLEELFLSQEGIKLGAEIEQLAFKINRELKEVIDNSWVRYYEREKDKRIYGI